MKHKKIDRSKIKLDESKLTNYSEVLDKKYGKRGTKSRDEFIEKAYTYYYGEILEEHPSLDELLEGMSRTKRHDEQIDNYVGKERFWEDEN